MSVPHEQAEVLQAVEALRAELASLRSRCENVEKAFASIEAQCEEAQAIMAHTHSRFEQLRSDLVEARRDAAEAQDALDTVGPTGLAIARRLAKLSLHFPAGGWLAKRLVRGGVFLRDKVRRPGPARPLP